MLALAMDSKKSGGSSSVTLVLFIVLIGLAVMMFLSSRRRRQQQAKQQQTYQIGDEVGTTSGLLGTLTGLTDDTATVRVSDGVEMTFVRRAVVPRATVLPQSAGTTALADDADGTEGDDETHRGDAQSADKRGSSAQSVDGASTASTDSVSLTKDQVPAEVTEAPGAATAGPVHEAKAAEANAADDDASSTKA